MPVFLLKAAGLQAPSAEFESLWSSERSYSRGPKTLNSSVRILFIGTRKNQTEMRKSGCSIFGCCLGCKRSRVLIPAARPIIPFWSQTLPCAQGAIVETARFTYGDCCVAAPAGTSTNAVCILSPPQAMNVPAVPLQNGYGVPFEVLGRAPA
jgi:hypothetical protein